jgi:hypothetical protein
VERLFSANGHAPRVEQGAGHGSRWIRLFAERVRAEMGLVHVCLFFICIVSASVS